MDCRPRIRQKKSVAPQALSGQWSVSYSKSNTTLAMSQAERQTFFQKEISTSVGQG